MDWYLKTLEFGRYSKQHVAECFARKTAEIGGFFANIYNRKEVKPLSPPSQREYEGPFRENAPYISRLYSRVPRNAAISP